MFGLDQLISGLGGGGLPMVLLVALLLGLRHATDPDHLVAVSTLLATERERPHSRAARLGLSWGLGHGTSLIALGVPIVALGRVIPAGIQSAAEVTVGLVIMALALRLVRRWRRGGFHVHEHVHDGVAHRHLHLHADRAAHDHEHRPTRSPVQAFGIGLVHGIAGSGAVTVLLLASVSGRREALAALGLFALGTALSMASLSFGAGWILAGRPTRRHFRAYAPALGAFSFAFGAWYALGALHGL